METPPEKKLKIDPADLTKHSFLGKSYKKGTLKPALDLESCDFSKIVATDGFVDKTLLIKALFENTCKVLITAPRRFGKSTNLDMVKRFLEIEVDSCGRPIDVSMSESYKIFSENKLKICEHEQFCKVHLGRHPVMIINFKPLASATDFESFLSVFKTVVRNTFEHHNYLSEISNLWYGNLKLDRFKKFTEADKNPTLDVYDIKLGFNFLAEVLHKHFGKPVFLLIDEYDAYFDSFVFKDNADYSRIINFIQSTTADLLKSNNHIDHALLTGVFRVSSEGLALTFSQSLNGIIHYKFLHKHPFYKYYGLTSKECDLLLNQFVKGDEEINKCKRTIDKYFNGFRINKVNIYCIWSVLKFFQNDKKIRSNSIRDDTVLSIKQVFNNERICETILNLLCGTFIDLDINKQFSRNNIKDFCCLLKLREQGMDTSELFFVFLYHLGFLSVVNIKDDCIASLRIPNQEVFFQFAKLLLESYENKYQLIPDSVKHFQSAANSFNSTDMSDGKFLKMRESINVLLSNKKYHSHIKNNLIYILFVILACKFSFIKFERSPSSNNIQYFVTLNDHDVVIIIAPVVEKANNSVKDKVIDIHNLLIQNDYFTFLERKIHKKLRGKVYIICHTVDNTLSLAYSSVLKGKEITQPKII